MTVTGAQAAIRRGTPYGDVLPLLRTEDEREALAAWFVADPLVPALDARKAAGRGEVVAHPLVRRATGPRAHRRVARVDREVEARVRGVRRLRHLRGHEDEADGAVLHLRRLRVHRRGVRVKTFRLTVLRELTPYWTPTPLIVALYPERGRNARAIVHNALSVLLRAGLVERQVRVGGYAGRRPGKRGTLVYWRRRLPQHARAS